MLELVGLFLSGFSTKMLDGFKINKFSKKEIVYSLVFSLFTLIGFLVGLNLVPEMVVGLVIGLIITGKMDTPIFKLMSLGYILMFMYFLLNNTINYFLLIGFFVTSVLDELEIVRDYRPFLPLFSLMLFFIGYQHYLFAILSFDIGYVLAAFIKKRFISWFFWKVS